MLAEALPYSLSLKFLNLSNCNLRDSGGSKIAEAFKYNDSCKTLILTKNKLAHLTGTEFGQVFRVNTALEELELGWNDMYSEQNCMVPFMKGLQTNNTLKRLGLSWNALFGNSFIFYLCKVVRLHPTLHTLDLKFNR
jgi:Ran GTPase-activating protein (RanGAP) involved in mRNA processing and transport